MIAALAFASVLAEAPAERRAELRHAVLLSTDKWDILQGPYDPKDYRAFLALYGMEAAITQTSD